MRKTLIVFVIGWVGVGMMQSQATEEAAYTSVLREDRFELRDYESHIVAEVRVEGSLESAGNRAFNSLFAYISGDNQRSDRIAMTAPVSQRPAADPIPMTAPVGQRAEGEGWVVSFMMPASYTMATLPVPDNPAVVLREVPAHRVAAIRYSGRWSEQNFATHLADLNTWIDANGWEIVGPPVWARYNAPFVPWFLRRNEILVAVAGE